MLTATVNSPSVTDTAENVSITSLKEITEDRFSTVSVSFKNLKQFIAVNSPNCFLSKTQSRGIKITKRSNDQASQNVHERVKVKTCDVIGSRLPSPQIVLQNFQ